MLDYKGNELKVGDEVCFAPAGAYAGVCIGFIEKITEKQVGIKKTVYEGRNLRSGKNRLYYTNSNQILKIREVTE